jgi:hypothetical protein
LGIAKRFAPIFKISIMKLRVITIFSYPEANNR